MATIYYVTQYALTRGILRVAGEDAKEAGPYLYVGRYRQQIAAKHWFTSREEAEMAAAEQVKRRIASLTKAADRLSRYTAKVSDWTT